jgi:hypothetical protein
MSRPITDDFRSAFNLITDLIPPDEHAVFSLRHSPATVYTQLTTLLIMTLQRFAGGISLSHVVREVIGHHAHLFPDNKRVRDGKLSVNPSGYSKSRQALSIKATEAYCDRVAEAIIARQPKRVQEFPIYVIDGTTIALSPTCDLTEVYPPATNQHGQSVWPIMMITVAHELYSGAALRPEFGAMYGNDNTSEAEQIESLAKRIPANSILLADSGYGIFRVVYRCHQESKQHLLCRLTNSRFKPMKKNAKLISNENGIEHYRLHWKPSVKDRSANPDLPEDASITVEIYRKILDDGEPLNLISTLALDPAEAVKIYSLRYTAVEHDIRDIKTTLNLERMSAQSDEMVRKEILCSMVAYNLIVQFRREAADRTNVLPRRISFKRCYETVQCYLFNFGTQPLEEWMKRYEQAVTLASKDKHPIRERRSFPRRAHPKRPKSAKLKQRGKSNTGLDLPPNGTPSG